MKSILRADVSCHHHAAVTKKVSFPELPPLPPLTQDEIEAMEEILSKNATTTAVKKTPKAKNVTSSQLFYSRARRFRNQVSNLEIALDDLTTDSGPASTEQCAAVIKQADPAMRQALQKLLKSAFENDCSLSVVAEVIVEAATEVEEYLRSVLRSLIEETSKPKSIYTRQYDQPLLPELKAMELHLICASIRAKVEAIDEDDPNRARKEAAAHAASYPALRTLLSSFLDTVTAGKMSRFAAFALGSMTMTVVDTAFDSLNRDCMKTVNIVEGFDDTVLIRRNIPHTVVTQVELSDLAAVILMYRAEFTISNIKDLGNILETPHAWNATGTALHECHIHIVERECTLLGMQVLSVGLRKLALQNMDAEESKAARMQIDQEVRDLQQEWEKNEELLSTTRQTAPIVGASKINDRAIEDVRTIAKTVLRVADELMDYFSTR